MWRKGSQAVPAGVAGMARWSRKLCLLESRRRRWSRGLRPAGVASFACWSRSPRAAGVAGMARWSRKLCLLESQQSCWWRAGDAGVFGDADSDWGNNPSANVVPRGGTHRRVVLWTKTLPEKKAASGLGFWIRPVAWESSSWKPVRKIRFVPTKAWLIRCAGLHFRYHPI
jgi:hypothetical protein